MLYQVLASIADEKNIKKLYKNKNNKIKISGPTSNENFQLPERSYSISNIQGKTWSSDWYITEIILVHWNISFGQLLDISRKNVDLKSFNSEFSCIEIWFKVQNSKVRRLKIKYRLL